MRKLLFFFTIVMLFVLIYITGISTPVNTESTVRIPETTEAAPVIPEETEETAAETEGPVQTEPEEGLRLTELFTATEQFEAYNNELQMYMTEQTVFEDNKIKFTADLIQDEYLSGKAESQMAFRYGTFSFRIMTTHKKGMFPAIWMLPASEERFPEVDIYEAIGNEPYRFHAGIHYDGTEERKNFFQHYFSKEMAQSTYVLKFEWTEGKMLWYVNDAEVGRITHNCPDMPMYLICNLAIGGSWTGLPKDDAFPEQYEIEILEFAPDEVYHREADIKTEME